MDVELVVFDMAGTTVVDNNFVAKAFQNAFKNNGFYIIEEEVNPFMGYHKPQAIKMLLKKNEEQFDKKIIEAIHNEFVNEMLDFYEYSPLVKPIPDAEDVFLFLKERSIKIALNTGFPRSIAEVIVKRFQWMERGLINDFIASNEVEKGRPFPYMIETLKKRNNISSEYCIMKVGDTVVDILEGKNAHCQYIVGVTTGAATKEELEFFEPTHVISSLSQIPAILSEAFRYV